MCSAGAQAQDLLGRQSWPCGKGDLVGNEAPEWTVVGTLRWNSVYKSLEYRGSCLGS